MLVEKYTNRIEGIMLVNGAAMIASVSFDGQTYSLDQPHSIQQRRTEQGVEAHLVPSVPSKDPTTLVINLDKSHVLFPYPLPEEVEQAYGKMTSRLMLPPTLGMLR